MPRPSLQWFLLWALPVAGVSYTDVAIARKRAVGVHVIGTLHQLSGLERDLQAYVLADQVVVVQLGQVPADRLEVCVVLLVVLLLLMGNSRKYGQRQRPMIRRGARGLSNLCLHDVFFGIVVAM